MNLWTAGLGFYGNQNGEGPGLQLKRLILLKNANGTKIAQL